LVCRRRNTSLPPPPLSGAQRVPREILKHIFSCLTPWDFDAARHTCKSWFLASLDKKVLDPMLSACGCQSGLAADINRLKVNILARRRSWDTDLHQRDMDVDEMIDKEWMSSKRLATEVRLSSCWRGKSSSCHSAATKLAPLDVVDFSRILYPLESPHKPKFTVSACGNFVLLVSSGDISVYGLADPNHSLVPIIRLATGIDVLKVSMDTSSDRFSVAALLSGRIGMLWDLSSTDSVKLYRSSSGEAMNLAMQTSVHSSAKFQYFRPSTVSIPIRAPDLFSVDSPDYNLLPSSHDTHPSAVPSTTAFL
jgi:hypothetical protein